MPANCQKPVIVSSFFGRDDSAARRFQDGGIPVFDGPEKAAAAMATLNTYREIQYRSEYVAPFAPPASEKAVAIWQQAANDGWDEFRSKEMLRAYAIPTCHEILAGSVEDAVAAAETIGYPVVVKGCHQELQHKTEQGLVHLDLSSAEMVLSACDAIRHQAEKADFLVCEMVKGDREFIAGVHRHPSFPPCILFGLGGIWAEALEDTATRLAPLNRSEAMAQLKSIRAQALLGSYRGLPEVNHEALADILVRLGQLALDFPGIDAIDLNPILIRDGQPVVVDALFVVSKQENKNSH